MRFGPLVLVTTALVLAFSQGTAAAPSAFDQAVQSYKAGRYSQSLAQFQAVSAANPADALSHYYMALCYQGLNQVASATQQYQWVATYSRDPSLRSMAQAGLARLAQYSARRTYGGAQTAVSSGASSVRGAGSSSVSLAPVRQVLEFYTDWCGVCKQFAPTFEEAKSRFSQVRFEQLNAEDPANERLVTRYGIKAYPTLVYLDGSGNVIRSQSGAPMGDAFFQTLERMGARR